MKYLFEMIRDREPKSSSSSSSEEFTSSLSSSRDFDQEKSRPATLPQPFPLNLPQPPSPTTTTTHFQNENEALVEAKKEKSLKLRDGDSELVGESMSDYEDTSSYLNDEPRLDGTEPVSPLVQLRPESKSTPSKDQSPDKLGDNENRENDIHYTSSSQLRGQTLVVGSGSESEESQNDASGNPVELEEVVLPLPNKIGGDLNPDGGESKGKEEIVVKDQEEKLLLQKLMVGYERDVRPVRNASQPVLVRVGITLTQIFDMVRSSLWDGYHNSKTIPIR